MQSSRSVQDSNSRSPQTYPVSSRSRKSQTPSSSRINSQRVNPSKLPYLSDSVPRRTKEVDYFSNQGFASSPWIVGPGINKTEYSIVQERDFFSYSPKNMTNSFSGATISPKASHHQNADCECELIDGSRIKCEKMKCEFIVSEVCGGILFGVASAEDTVLGSNWLEDERCINRVWYYASPLGRFFNGPRKIPNKKAQCEEVSEAIRAGDSVTIEIDINLKTALFFVNSKLCGKISYSCDTVRPAVYLFAKGSSVRVSSFLLQIYESDHEQRQPPPVEAKTMNDGTWERWHELISIRDSGNKIFDTKKNPLVAFSSAVRQGGEFGSCCAILAYFASTKWSSGKCTGKKLSVEFEVKRRIGAIDFGVVSSAVPVSGTWCVKSYKTDTYWYSWSGALRRGCELNSQSQCRFFEGDIVRIEIDLFLGRVSFFVKENLVGDLIVESVDAVRRQEEFVAVTRRHVLSEMANITSLQKQIQMGRLAIVPEVNRLIAALAVEQVKLVSAASMLLDMANECTVQLFPAVSMCCEGDEVIVDGSVAFQVEDSKPENDELARLPDLLKATKPISPLSEIQHCKVMKEVRQFLGKTGSPLLDLLSDSEFDRLTDGYYMTLESDSKLKSALEDEVSSLYILIEGKLSVRVDGAVGMKEVAILDQQGHAFGELAVTSRKKFKAEIVALCPSIVFEVSREILGSIIDKREDILSTFQAKTQQRVNSYSLIGEAWRGMFLLRHQTLMN